MSPFLALIIAAFLLIILQFVIGSRGSLETRRIYSYMLRDARKRARRTFTTVIMLDRRAETIYPLLDHLYGQDYDKLQVLVVVKQTAGSRAANDLQVYKRQNRHKGLKVVRHQKRMDSAQAATLYGTGQYVITLRASDRLSPRFFEVSSQVLTATQPDALSVRLLVRPARTFKHALWALVSLVRTAWASTTPRYLPTELVIIKRQSLKKKETANPLVFAISQFYSLQPSDVRFALSWRSLISFIAAGALVVGAYVSMLLFLDASLANLYIWIIVGAIEVAAIICMMQVRGYRAVDFLNILLFIPIAPLYALGYSLVRIVHSAVSALRRPRLSTPR